MFDMTWLHVWGTPVPLDVCCRGSHLTPITETTVTSGTLLPGCNWVLMEAWPSHCESCYHQPMAGNAGCVLEDLVIYYLWGITLSSLRCVISRPPLGRFTAYTDPFMLKPTHFLTLRVDVPLSTPHISEHTSDMCLRVCGCSTGCCCLSDPATCIFVSRHAGWCKPTAFQCSNGLVSYAYKY